MASATPYLRLPSKPYRHHDSLTGTSLYCLAIEALWMRLSFNLVNVYTKLVNVYQSFTHDMAASYKTQMVLSHDKSVILSNCQQQTLMSHWQSSVKFIYRLVGRERFQDGGSFSRVRIIYVSFEFLFMICYVLWWVNMVKSATECWEMYWLNHLNLLLSKR